MRTAITAALLALALASAQPIAGVAILQVDTDRRIGTIDPRIYAGGATDFCARFLDADDAPVRGIRVRLGPE